MKTLVKVGLGLLAVAGLGWYIYKSAKKTYVALEKREKNNHEALREAGYTEQQVKEDTPVSQDDMEVNICMDVFKAIHHGVTDIDEDSVDANTIFGGDNYPSEHVVHVKQRFDQRLGRYVVDLIFEVPKDALPYGGKGKSSDGCVGLFDFRRDILGMRRKRDEEYMGDEEPEYINPKFLSRTLEEMISFYSVKKKSDKPFLIGSSITGYIFLKFTDLDGTESFAMKEIVRGDYDEKKYKFPTDFIYHLRESDQPKVLLIRRKIEASVEDAFGAIKLTFLMSDKYHLDGMNDKSLLKIMEMLSCGEDFVVCGTKGPFVYNNFLLYNPDDESGQEVYAIDERDGRIISMSSL